MESELKAQFSVKGPDGKEIVKKTAVTDGSKLLCEFVKGEKYTAEVTATGGEGNYVLLLGQQKATVDVSDYDRVQDSIEFEDQVNNYTFAPEVSGTYRFVIESDSSDFSMSFRICDEDSKAGGGNVEDAEEVSVDMAAGKKYRIEAACSGKTCRYGFSIYRPEASRDVTGKSIICDAVLYEGQKKAYTFKAAQSGQYRITVGNMDDDCRVKLYVYSSLGDKISGEDDLGNGDSVTAEFAEGQGCQIQLTGSGGTGSYTITMAKFQIGLLSAEIETAQFLVEVAIELPDVDPVDQRVVYEESDGDRYFDLFDDLSVLQGEVFLRLVAAPADIGDGEAVVGVGHHGLRVVEPRDAGGEEKA